MNSNIDTLVKNSTLLDDVQSNVYCCNSGVSPFDNYLNFDNFLRGMFIVLHVITIDGWNELAWPVANTAGTPRHVVFLCCRRFGWFLCVPVIHRRYLRDIR